MIPFVQVSVMVVLVGISLVITCVVQNSPPLLVSSPALSMVVPAFVISATPSDGSLGAFLRLTIATAELSLVLLATILISGAVKVRLLLYQLIKCYAHTPLCYIIFLVFAPVFYYSANFSTI